MNEERSSHRVAVGFVGAAPAAAVERAWGVSGLDVDGPVLRCLVTGGFQPFLEALLGHEVLTLQSTPVAGPASRCEGGR